MTCPTSISRTSLCLLAILAASLSACSSAPIHYHTLVPIKGSPAGQTDSTLQIVIDRVSMPPQVDRSQLVIREGKSGLVILETEWWAANLTDELQNALTNQLTPMGTAPADRSKLHLTLEVQRFDSVPGQYALIEAKWRLRSRAANVAMECYSTLRTVAGNTIDDLVIAHQQNVNKLSSAIEAAGKSGRCP